MVSNRVLDYHDVGKRCRTTRVDMNDALCNYHVKYVEARIPPFSFLHVNSTSLKVFLFLKTLKYIIK